MTMTAEERRNRARRWVPGGVEDGAGRLRRGGHCMRYEAQTGFGILGMEGGRNEPLNRPERWFPLLLTTAILGHMSLNRLKLFAT